MYSKENYPITGFVLSEMCRVLFEIDKQHEKFISKCKLNSLSYLVLEKQSVYLFDAYEPIKWNWNSVNILKS